MDTNGKFYLGRLYDPTKGKTTSQSLLYDPADLTTHAVVVGMTGSGKTGLCISLLEEAALNHIPALLVDPKGDITNVLLHFPDLLPTDFQPWVDPDQARRAGQTLEQAAEEAASRWKAGLAEWDITPERVRLLQEAAHFAVYTPGSDTGIPVSILASFTAPSIPWESNREVLREKISGTVTALLGLVGLREVDPVRSREHILLSNIFEHAWSQGQSLDLGSLILQTQTPPFAKLGVFEVNTFFPEKDRFALAMLLNNILAAPAFQTWLEGQPLDIPSLLYAPDGRPQHSVFYLAHLTDDERMFFVTLLFAAVETWMRSQSGSSSLRAILYFDEIFGYLPPVANPPSKEPMLRMLKQARAFGVGLVLVTQNPVDVDYKGLSNAGSWFIGKLQTDQDKQRLLDGLQGAMGGAMDRGEYDRLISSLAKRVFLLNNVHEGQPQLFQTRWAMNYLAGPLSRAQIPALNQLAGAVPTAIGSQTQAPAANPPTKTSEQPLAIGDQPAVGNNQPTAAISAMRPNLPAGLAEYFLPANLSISQAFEALGMANPSAAQSQGLVYFPAILAQAQVRFLNSKYNLDTTTSSAALVADPKRHGAIRWEDFETRTIDPGILNDQPEGNAQFAALDTPFTQATTMRSIQTDFQDWVYRTLQAKVRANEALKVYGGPQISQADFYKLCSEAPREGRDAESKKVVASYDKQVAALQTQLSRLKSEAAKDKNALDKKEQEAGGLKTASDLFYGRGSILKRASKAMDQQGKAGLARDEYQASLKAMEEVNGQIAALEAEKAQTLAGVNQRWGEVTNQISEISVSPLKKDIVLELFGLAWLPHYVVQTSGKKEELLAFKQ